MSSQPFTLSVTAAVRFFVDLLTQLRKLVFKFGHKFRFVKWFKGFLDSFTCELSSIRKKKAILESVS